MVLTKLVIQKSGDNNPRTTVVNFVWYKTRRKLFVNKNRSKNGGISIAESFIQCRMALYKRIIRRGKIDFGVTYVWTIDGQTCSTVR